MAKINTVSRSTAKNIDLIHIVLGIVIVVMSVMAFTNPVDNMVLFPLIFFAAAALKIICGVTVVTRYDSEHDKKLRFRGSLQIVTGMIIFGIGIISAVSIWF